MTNHRLKPGAPENRHEFVENGPIGRRLAPNET
jgi:hypothetical protein